MGIYPLLQQTQLTITSNPKVRPTVPATGTSGHHTVRSEQALPTRLLPQLTPLPAVPRVESEILHLGTLENLGNLSIPGKVLQPTCLCLSFLHSQVGVITGALPDPHSSGIPRKL